MPRALSRPTFRPGYALTALFAIEIVIALWVHDRFVRPTGGDVLAVLLVYCALRAVIRIGVVPAALAAVATGCAIEAGQALDLVDRLGLGGSVVARTLLGASFSVGDLAAYALGGLIAVGAERLRARA